MSPRPSLPLPLLLPVLLLLLPEGRDALQQLGSDLASQGTNAAFIALDSSEEDHQAAVGAATMVEEENAQQTSTTADRRKKKATTPLCKNPKDGVALTASDLKTSQELGRHFLLVSQKENGEFHYEYDWKKELDSEGEPSPIRIAGAAWGMALMALDQGEENGGKPDQELVAALRRALDFFDQHSKDFEDGRRIVVYPGLEKKYGSTGALAVLALAHIDYLRGIAETKADGEADAEEEERSRKEHLHGLLLSLKGSLRKDDLVHKHYHNKDGEFLGESTPYYDGEVLLAFTKAAKYLGMTEYWPIAKRMAEAGWDLNVKEGLEEGKDLDVMKGYYQWSSMAWYELLTSEKESEFQDYKQRLVDFGLWQVNVHDLLSRTRNIGYAFEGLVPAYLLATELEDDGGEAAEVLGCAIDQGLRMVSAMQLGHPLAQGVAREAGESAAEVPERFRGGVQNSLDLAPLRIDTTQHQMHAVLMARRLLEGKPLI